MPKASLVASTLSFSFLIASGTAFAQCALPNQLASGDLADATKVAANFTALANCADDQSPSGSANSILYNAGSGSISGTTPLADGQVLIGSSGNPPQTGTLTAGSGVAITSGPASITVSATGSGTGVAVDWLNKAAVVKPVTSAFTMRTSTTAPIGAALSSTTRGMLLSVASSADNRVIMAETSLPAGSWQATMLAVYTGPLSNYVQPGITVRDSTSNRAVTFSQGGNGSGTTYRFDYIKTSGGIGLDANAGDSAFQDIGFSTPSEPIWQRLTYDGTNLIWSFSRDGEFFIPAYSVAANAALVNLNKIGPAIIFAGTIRQTWSASFHVLSWNVAGI